MNVDAIWAFYVLVLITMGFAALPLFRFVDRALDSPSRYSSIDGLRGFLAVSVFAFHLIVTHRFIETGAWEIPDSRFYVLLGPVGVSLFFMISGFLLWGKLLRSKGQTRWRDFYLRRLFRIAPMYLFVVLVMLYIVLARTGFQRAEPTDVVARAIVQWLALGMIDTQPDVNGYRASHVLAGVTWTLWYEWVFYALLFVTAYFARGRAHLVFVFMALAAALAAKSLLNENTMGFAVLFLSGMAIASLLHENMHVRLSPNISSTLALAILWALFTTSSDGYATYTTALLATFFYLVCSGATIFGLLDTTPAQRLGNISYSFYLMQGLALTLVFAIDPVRAFAMTSPQNYWVVGNVCACVLLIGSAVGYAYVERPGIALGKRVAQRRGTPYSGSTQHTTDIDHVA